MKKTFLLKTVQENGILLDVREFSSYKEAEDWVAYCEELDPDRCYIEEINYESAENTRL